MKRDKLAVEPARRAADVKLLFQQEIDILWGFQPDADCPTARMTASGDNWFAAEWIEGQTLDKIDLRDLPAKDILKLFLKVLAALGRVHDKGIVHRDLKPGNIMITPEGDVKIIDFGAAKKDRGVILSDPKSAVTPHYVSPEGVMYSEAGNESDLYQAALILYWMITQKHALEELGITAYNYWNMDIVGKVMTRLPNQTYLRRELYTAAYSGDKKARTISAREISSRYTDIFLPFMIKALETKRQLRYESAVAMAGEVTRMLRDIDLWEQKYQRTPLVEVGV